MIVTYTQPGNTITTGIGPPDDGTNGDYYIDEENLVLYGPKIEGVWPSGIRLQINIHSIQLIQSLDLNQDVEWSDLLSLDSVLALKQAINLAIGKPVNQALTLNQLLQLILCKSVIHNLALSQTVFKCVGKTTTQQLIISQLLGYSKSKNMSNRLTVGQVLTKAVVKGVHNNLTFGQVIQLTQGRKFGQSLRIAQAVSVIKFKPRIITHSLKIKQTVQSRKTHP